MEKGLPYYEEGLKIRRELADRNPENRDYALGYARASILLGNVERHAGKSLAARQRYETARTVLQKAHAATPADKEVELQIAISMEKEAVMLADLGESAKAAPLLRSAADKLRLPNSALSAVRARL